ncbi:unnamed protein product, partial [Rotaria sordida]
MKNDRNRLLSLILEHFKLDIDL